MSQESRHFQDQNKGRAKKQSRWRRSAAVPQRNCQGSSGTGSLPAKPKGRSWVRIVLEGSLGVSLHVFLSPRLPSAYSAWKSQEYFVDGDNWYGGKGSCPGSVSNLPRYFFPSLSLNFIILNEKQCHHD